MLYSRHRSAFLAGMATLAALWLLPGCATLSEGECLTADWYQIGRQDGRQGYPRARLHDHRQACAEHGVQSDDSAYYAGREAGLEAYCTPGNALRAGRAGGKYSGVCPAAREADFLREYRKGKELRTLDEEIAGVERDIDARETQLEKDETADEEADQLRVELRNLYRQLRYLSRELLALEQRYQPRR